MLYQNTLLILTTCCALNTTVAGLQPYSLQSFSVTACTAAGCTASDTVLGRTQEAPPTGTVGLNVQVAGPRSIQVLWNPVAVPNGIVYYYIYCEGYFYVDPGLLIGITL